MAVNADRIRRILRKLATLESSQNILVLIINTGFFNKALLQSLDILGHNLSESRHFF